MPYYENYSSMAAQTEVLASNRARLIYTSFGTVTVGGGGAGGATRSSMLPTGGGASSLTIKAGKLGVGSALLLNGAGIISAASVSPGTFNFTPHVTPDGGSKTDLGGLSVTPLIGVPGRCSLWLCFVQTATGIQTGGVVDYGTTGGMPYFLQINPNATIVASDPNVDRTFGVDGQWMTSNAANYITSQIVLVNLATLSPANI